MTSTLNPTTTQLVLTLDVDGTVQAEHWPAGDSFPHLQRSVGNHATALDLSLGMTMWVNEELLDDGQPLNAAATLLAGQHGHCQVIFGPVVIAGTTANPLSVGAREHVTVLIAQISDDLR